MNNVTGLPELLAKFQQLGDEGTAVANRSLSVVADFIVGDAKQRAPNAFGKISQGIVPEKLQDLLYKVAATAPESPFQEFGTGGKVDVPEEMADIASQFQGEHGGGMVAFIQALVDWINLRGLTNVYSVKSHRVTKKGTADQNTQLAWAIAKKILRDGLTPQPFLYPAFVAQSQKLIPMLQTGLQELLRSKQS